MGTSPPTFSENSRLQIMVEPSDYQRRIRYHTTERIVEEKLSSSYALHPKPVRASREQIGTPPRSSGDGRVLASTPDVPDDKRAHRRGRPGFATRRRLFVLWRRIYPQVDRVQLELRRPNPQLVVRGAHALAIDEALSLTG